MKDKIRESEFMSCKFSHRTRSKRHDLILKEKCLVLKDFEKGLIQLVITLKY